MRRSEPLKLDRVIQQMIDRTGLREEYERRTVESLWPDVVGRNIASYTRRVVLRERVLHVEIVSAALKEELSFMRDDLVRHINEAAHRDAIDAIIIH